MFKVETKYSDKGTAFNFFGFRQSCEMVLVNIFAEIRWPKIASQRNSETEEDESLVTIFLDSPKFLQTVCLGTRLSNITIKSV